MLLKIQNTEKISDLIRLLALQIGRLVNHNEISNTLNIASVTLKKYLWYLEKTFIINRVNPFFKNVRKEITKSPVYYFHDIGLKNYSSGVFAAKKPLNVFFFIIFSGIGIVFYERMLILWTIRSIG